jgi:chromosomal replication initiation ATPase DnaA
MLTPSALTGVPEKRQQQILEHLKANPLSSYVFSGAPGVGKTTFMRELQRLSWDAQWKNHAVYAKTATQYQADATATARGEAVRGFVRPQHFHDFARQGIRYSVFLDDVDKITGTEFIRKEFFALVDSAIQERTPSTQLALTTNMTLPEFAKFFGDAITWRIRKYCAWVPVVREKVA